MFENLKTNVIKDLIGLSQLGVDIGSALTKVKSGFFDKDLQDWDEGGASTVEATETVMVMSNIQRYL